MSTRTKVSKRSIIASIVVDGVILAANATVGVLCITGRKNTSDSDKQFALGLAAGANLACASTVDILLLGNDINRLIKHNKAEKASKNSEAVETK